MIDLHLHTTASDGALTPAGLVARAAAAGLTTFSVTDHDTVAGLAEAREAAEARRLTLIDGIEITAVEGERDVHVLGYFFDPDHAGLRAFLATQREDRVRRVRDIATRLAALGVPIDAGPILRLARESGRSVGRPHIAAALVAAGHVSTRDEAFGRYLERTAAAFVPRRGAPVAEVVRVLAEAGGLASLAHPGLTDVDELIPGFARAGLAAIEARHSDHTAQTESRYREIARTHRLAISGGSDFHGDSGHHRCALGTVALDPPDFDALQSRRP